MPTSPREGPMQLVRFYLPLSDNAGVAFPRHMYDAIEAELSQRFGGVTAHLESPASGRWQHGGATHADDVVIFEVLLAEVDHAWWRQYRTRLERDFAQTRVLVMTQAVDIL